MAKNNKNKDHNQKNRPANNQSSKPKTPPADQKRHRPNPMNPIKRGAEKLFRRGGIQEVVRELTAGGIIYRRNNRGGIEILLIQDAKDRWTIPKGHIEEGEKPDETAEREIMEETGLQKMNVHAHLGKVNFRYRRQDSLVLITMHVYLVEALGDTNKLRKESWMNDIKWFPATEAFDIIEYDDIGKLVLLAMKRIRSGQLK
ncbi:TPA: NUDIX domain-containing protein [Candidatus Saccharibacteria bacterium]|nr:NUDIX domain-containing protein [Candidatus Saccharibacteria bacterium]HIO87505.1 NUDIX domain-containing protein [Candidatus Saccharibacteria bacterium]